MDILQLPADHTENIVYVGFHVTTAIMFIANTVYRNMLGKGMNSSVRHAPKYKDVLSIK